MESVDQGGKGRRGWGKEGEARKKILNDLYK